MSPAKKPSRRKRSTTSRLRRFWIVFAFVLVVVGVGAYFAATWPALDPHRIDVSGNRVVSTGQILAAAAIDRHRNLWLQSAHGIVARVEAIPFVDRAWLHRSLPAHATIAVTERVPFATVQSDGTSALVDRTMRVLTTDAGTAAVPAIIVPAVVQPPAGQREGDERVLRLGVDLATLQAAGLEPHSVRFDRFGGLIATRTDGIEILLGDDDDLTRKLALVEPIRKQTAGGRPIRAIDLRAPGTPIIVYRT